MPLISLAGLTPERASNILAQAALQIGPHIRDQEINADQYAIDTVMYEICSKLSLSMENLTDKDRARIDEELASELEHVGFPDIDFAAVTKSLGTQGELSIESYNLLFAQEGASSFEEKEGFVRSCVLHADTVQHIRAPQSALNTAHEMSIIMKWKKAKRKSHWVLIHASRFGTDLVVAGIWRVFPDIVDLEDALQPLDVLRKFALHYGVDIVARGTDITSKFIENTVTISWDELQHISLFDEHVISQASAPEQNVLFVESGYKDQSIDHLVLTAAYGIDMARYLSDKRRRVS